MTIYTVHAPPSLEGSASDPERFEFVRDGFHVWAFVFGPVWLLAKRLWLATVIYVAIIVAVQAGSWVLAVPRSGHALITFLMHLLVGLEAATIERWTFNLRGWQEIGVVQAEKLDSAERRFFDFLDRSTKRVTSGAYRISDRVSYAARFFRYYRAFP